MRIGVVDNRIGGLGIIVEVDESKFGHRKYNRGFPVEGRWVIGGVERTNEARMFAVGVVMQIQFKMCLLLLLYLEPWYMLIVGKDIMRKKCWIMDFIGTL